MHALRLPSRFPPQCSPRRLSFALQKQFLRNIRRGSCLFLLIATLLILASTVRTAHATSISTRSQTKVAVTMNLPSPQQAMRHANTVKSRPLIPLGGWPMFPAVLLWFPETDGMTDVQVVGVQPESGDTQSRSYRWIRIGMLLLFGMGLLGMLFG
jgi:hypothetical protein